MNVHNNPDMSSYTLNNSNTFNGNNFKNLIKKEALTINDIKDLKNQINQIFSSNNYGHKFTLIENLQHEEIKILEDNEVISKADATLLRDTKIRVLSPLTYNDKMFLAIYFMGLYRQKSPTEIDISNLTNLSSLPNGVLLGFNQEQRNSIKYVRFPTGKVTQTRTDKLSIFPNLTIDLRASGIVMTKIASAKMTCINKLAGLDPHDYPKRLVNLAETNDFNSLKVVLEGRSGKEIYNLKDTYNNTTNDNDQDEDNELYDNEMPSRNNGLSRNNFRLNSYSGISEDEYDNDNSSVENNLQNYKIPVYNHDRNSQNSFGGRGISDYDDNENDYPKFSNFNQKPLRNFRKPSEFNRTQSNNINDNRSPSIHNNRYPNINNKRYNEGYLDHSSDDVFKKTPNNINHGVSHRNNYSPDGAKTFKRNTSPVINNGGYNENSVNRHILKADFNNGYTSDNQDNTYDVEFTSMERKSSISQTDYSIQNLSSIIPTYITSNANEINNNFMRRKELLDNLTNLIAHGNEVIKLCENNTSNEVHSGCKNLITTIQDAQKILTPTNPTPADNKYLESFISDITSKINEITKLNDGDKLKITRLDFVSKKAENLLNNAGILMSSQVSKDAIKNSIEEIKNANNINILSYEAKLARSKATENINKLESMLSLLNEIESKTSSLNDMLDKIVIDNKSTLGELNDKLDNLKNLPIIEELNNLISDDTIKNTEVKATADLALTKLKNKIEELTNAIKKVESKQQEFKTFIALANDTLEASNKKIAHAEHAPQVLNYKKGKELNLITDLTVIESIKKANESLQYLISKNKHFIDQDTASIDILDQVTKNLNFAISNISISEDESIKRTKKQINDLLSYIQECYKFMQEVYLNINSGSLEDDNINKYKEGIAQRNTKIRTIIGGTPNYEFINNKKIITIIGGIPNYELIDNNYREKAFRIGAIMNAGKMYLNIFSNNSSNNIDKDKRLKVWLNNLKDDLNYFENQSFIEREKEKVEKLAQNVIKNAIGVKDDLLQYGITQEGKTFFNHLQTNINKLIKKMSYTASHEKIEVKSITTGADGIEKMRNHIKQLESLTQELNSVINKNGGLQKVKKMSDIVVRPINDLTEIIKSSSELQELKEFESLQKKFENEELENEELENEEIQVLDKVLEEVEENTKTPANSNNRDNLVSQLNRGLEALEEIDKKFNFSGSGRNDVKDNTNSESNFSTHNLNLFSIRKTTSNKNINTQESLNTSNKNINTQESLNSIGSDNKSEVFNFDFDNISPLGDDTLLDNEQLLDFPFEDSI